MLSKKEFNRLVRNRFYNNSININCNTIQIYAFTYKQLIFETRDFDFYNFLYLEKGFPALENSLRVFFFDVNPLLLKQQLDEYANEFYGIPLHYYNLPEPLVQVFPAWAG